MTEEEKNALLSETGASDEEKKEVSVEDYAKIAESYANLRTLENRRDKEIKELREKVAKYEIKPAKVESEEEETQPDEDEVLRQKLIKFGFAPKEDVEKEVEKRMNLLEHTKSLQSEVKSAITKFPFVKESDLLDYIQEKKGALSVSEAIQLKYRKEMAAFEAANGDDSGTLETDAGGRTIAVKVAPSTGDETPMRRGIPKGFSITDMIANSLSKNVDKNAGVR